ncbi:putative leucine-rich repeat domain superfamily [Dioscorea sansibarensis]
MGTKPLPVWVERLLERTIQLALVKFQETELISIKWLSLSSLEYLEVVYWPNLTKLLGDELLLHEQIQLKEMIIRRCPRLTSLIPSSLWQKLERLSVKDCPMIMELFPCDHKAHDKTELLPRLLSLDLRGLQRLQNVLQPFQCLPNLTRLDIDNCGVRYVVSSEMETVALLADPFPALEVLYIKNCQEMSAMISPGASLQALFFFHGLRSLTIESCPRLTLLFSYKQAISMQHLDSLRIEKCAALEAVVISTENKEEASASTSTHAVDCGSYNIPFPNLRDLCLYDLPQLTALHHPAALPIDWLYLQRCRVMRCPKLQHPLFRPRTPAHEQVVRPGSAKGDEEEGDDVEGGDEKGDNAEGEEEKGDPEPDR